MTRYIALLRAVNVGGTGKLPMAELKAMCTELGFSRIETYIASGNVVFDSSLTPSAAQARLEKRLLEYAGKPMGVFMRTAPELQSVLAGNPFKENDPRQVYAFFLNDMPPATFLDGVRGQADEETGVGQREIYVYYPQGMGQSKLQIPAVQLGTARNINTITKLVEMSARR